MFSKIFNVDGLRTGYIFDDHPEFYDAENNATKNIITGKGIEGCDINWLTTPTFRTDFGTNNRKSVRLDNSIRANFRNPIPEGGTILIVGKPNMVGTGANALITMIKGADVTNPLSMMSFYSFYGSGATRLVFNPSSGGFKAEILGITNNAPHFAALAIDGKDAESTTLINGGAAVSTVDPTPSTTNNIKFTPSQKRFWDLGYLNYDNANAAVLPDTYDIAAIFFIGRNPVRNQTQQIQDFQDQINEFYGIF